MRGRSAINFTAPHEALDSGVCDVFRICEGDCEARLNSLHCSADVRSVGEYAASLKRCLTS